MSEPPKVENIWQDCLKSFEMGASADGDDAQAVGEPYTMIVMGDMGAGKWTLVNGLRKPAPKFIPKQLSGVPLGYTFVSVEEDDGPADAYKLHSWLLDNPSNMPRFLPVALASAGGVVSAPPVLDAAGRDEEPESEQPPVVDEAVLENPALLIPVLERAVGVICVDLSQPWSIADSLKLWVTAISDEVETLLKSIDAVDNRGGMQLRAKLLEKVRKAKWVEPAVAAGGDGEGVPASPAKAGVDRVAGDSMPDEGYAGIPLIVVACKSDEIDSWHTKTYGDLEDGHIDYVKAHLRQACLDVGATLVYTSAKFGTNVETLRSYVLHRLVAGRPCAAGLGDTLDQKCTFVPSGHDTKKKVESLLSGVFGDSHPQQKMNLTGNAQVGMYPRLEKMITDHLKASMDKGQATFSSMSEAVKHWLHECVDASAPEAEVHRVVAMGMGVAVEAMAEMDVAAPVDVQVTPATLVHPSRLCATAMMVVDACCRISSRNCALRRCPNSRG
jgi:hypothetical protein